MMVLAFCVASADGWWPVLIPGFAVIFSERAYRSLPDSLGGICKMPYLV